MKIKLIDACERMNLNLKTLRHYIKTGIVKAEKINNRYYIDQTIVEQWNRGEIKTKGAFQSETSIERSVVDNLPSGVIGLKIYRTDWPDRLFVFKNGRVLFAEFKKLGEDPRKKQLEVIEMLRDFGFCVHVFDNKETALNIIEILLHT